jgi:6-pyruvoyltetrahydropterin/6-carboxytetrahydropterin synthase
MRVLTLADAPAMIELAALTQPGPMKVRAVTLGRYLGIFDRNNTLMIYELSQRFYFEAAHSLEREIDAEGSRRVHGHTYHAQVFVRGLPDPQTNMIVDLGHLNQMITSVRDQLDHRFLDEVPGLGSPTIENLCAFIYDKLWPAIPQLMRVAIERPASGDRCDYIAGTVIAA